MAQLPDDLPYCIECGARLLAGARLCPQCGTERWLPGQPPAPAAAPRRQPARTASPELGAKEVEATVSSIPWIYALGAVLSVALLAWLLAEAVTSGGRANWDTTMAQAGVARSQWASTRVDLTIFFGIILAVLTAAHAAAYQGLRARKRWGWMIAVVVAGLWSIVLTGIPVLIRLSQRQVRAAYGIN